MGGHVPNPTYRQVCGKQTGHAEVVQVTFEPREISFRELPQIFFTTHDPTTRDRQGADVGPQYRSVLLYHSPEQKQTAEEMVAELERQRAWPDPIVTEIEPLEAFYPAEAEHQGYSRRNPNQGYCRVVIAPKVAKLRSQYLEKLAG
jgi:peptide-methionine (S)-S-oxide reductase